jgi:hypothetical protein
MDVIEVDTTVVYAKRLTMILALPTGEATSPELWSRCRLASLTWYEAEIVVLAALLLRHDEALPRRWVAASADPVRAVDRPTCFSFEPQATGGDAILLGEVLAGAWLNAACAGLGKAGCGHQQRDEEDSNTETGSKARHRDTSLWIREPGSGSAVSMIAELPAEGTSGMGPTISAGRRRGTLLL